MACDSSRSNDNGLGGKSAETWMNVASCKQATMQAKEKKNSNQVMDDLLQSKKKQLQSGQWMNIMTVKAFSHNGPNEWKD